MQELSRSKQRFIHNEGLDEKVRQMHESLEGILSESQSKLRFLDPRGAQSSQRVITHQVLQTDPHPDPPIL